MQKGPLGGSTPNFDDSNPMAPHMARMEVENKQLNPQMFGKAGLEYINSGFGLRTRERYRSDLFRVY